MDFLACLDSAVPFEVILLLNIFEVKKVRAAISICYRIGERKMDQTDIYVLENFKKIFLSIQ